MEMSELTVAIATAIGGAAVVALAMLWKKVTDFTERHAAPLREIPEENRTLTQKLIIEADRRADMLNIEQYNKFLESYVAAYVTELLEKARVVGPMKAAEERVDDMIEKLADGNPELAVRLDQSYETAKRKLAGAIGEALQKNGMALPEIRVDVDGPEVDMRDLLTRR